MLSLEAKYGNALEALSQEDTIEMAFRLCQKFIEYPGLFQEPEQEKLRSVLTHFEQKQLVDEERDWLKGLVDGHEGQYMVVHGYFTNVLNGDEASEDFSKVHDLLFYRERVVTAINTLVNGREEGIPLVGIENILAVTYELSHVGDDAEKSVNDFLTTILGSKNLGGSEITE